MHRILTTAIVMAGLLAACAALATSELAAEPIPAGDSLATPWDTAAQTQELIDAQERFKSRDFDGALKLLKSAATKDSDLPPAEVCIAQLYNRANMPAKERNALEQAILEAPGDPEAYLVISKIALREGRFAEARLLGQEANRRLSSFDKSAKRKELLRPQILSSLAAVAEACKDWATARRTLDEWLKVDPNSDVARCRIANCLFQQKDVPGALAKLREATQSDSETLAPEAILARFYQLSGDHENAKKWMAAALTAAPRNLATRLAVGKWAMETGQVDEALKQAIEAMRINPKSVEAEFFRGSIALFQKDYRAAEWYFDSALKRSPHKFAIANNLAMALVEQDDRAKRDRALEIAEANVRQFPNLPEANATHGWVLYRLGRLDEAEKVLRTAVAGGGFSTDTAYYVARLAVDRGHKAEARQLLEGALSAGKQFFFRKEAEELLEQLKK
jgi:tetratricopeptide (TPR) repeat protein